MFVALENLAIKFYPIRKILVAASIIGFVAIFAVLRLTNLSGPVVFSLLSPLATWPWALVLVTTWFHPSEGQIAKMDDFRGANTMRVFPVLLCVAFFLSPVLFYGWSLWASQS